MDSYNSSQLKLLHTMEYFVMHTNKEHRANANDVISYLEKLGIKAERKSIYRNVDILNKFGVRIIKTRRTSTFCLDVSRMLVLWLLSVSAYFNLYVMLGCEKMIITPYS